MKKQAKESILGLLQSVEKAQLQPDFFDRLAPALLSRGILSSLGSAKEVWGDRIFEKCGIRRDEGGDGGKTLEIRGKRRLSARDGGANCQQS